MLPRPEDLKLRKQLSAPGLLNIVRAEFHHVSEFRKRQPTYSMTDCLMSGLAVFSFKSPSLLKFEELLSEETVRANLTSLYGVKKAPCDSQLREVLDPVSPIELRPAFVKIHALLQRQNMMEAFEFLDGQLLSIDGTGLYSSGKVSCPECCVKGKGDKKKYYHQALGAVIVHPDKKQVLPLFPEAITRQDGDTKNDCERNASKRLLTSIREYFPKRKFIVLEDGLASNAPHINLLKKLNYSFILGAKEGDHKALFSHVQTLLMAGETEEFEATGADGLIRGYRYVNEVSLNASHPELLVNYLEHWEIKPDGKETIFSWVTDLPLSKDTVPDIARGGRSRWKIENETFNTLKNQDYNFEHNYGHGKQHLSTVFANLMMLAFLIDQVQEYCCPLFKLAREQYNSRTSLWHKMKSLFAVAHLKDWETLWKLIIYGHHLEELTINSP